MSDPRLPSEFPPAPPPPAPPPPPPRPAVFIDRDNTIVEDTGYLHEPGRVVLLKGAAEGLGRIAAAGWQLVVISNQSGIARGLYGEEAYHAVMARVGELLAPHRAQILADYFCPHLPEMTGPCQCRKPGTLLFRRAAQEHGLDLRHAWYVGDRWRDIAPALPLGGRGLLVGTGDGSDDAREAARHGMPRAPDLVAASDIVGRPAV